MVENCYLIKVNLQNLIKLGAETQLSVLMGDLGGYHSKLSTRYVFSLRHRIIDGRIAKYESYIIIFSK